jgi:hypothetical protein
VVNRSVDRYRCWFFFVFSLRRRIAFNHAKPRLRDFTAKHFNDHVFTLQRSLEFFFTQKGLGAILPPDSRSDVFETLPGSNFTVAGLPQLPPLKYSDALPGPP